MGLSLLPPMADGTGAGRRAGRAVRVGETRAGFGRDRRGQSQEASSARSASSLGRRSNYGAPKYPGQIGAKKKTEARRPRSRMSFGTKDLCNEKIRRLV